MKQIVITGASGLIGRQALEMLSIDGIQIHAVLRTQLEGLSQRVIQHIGPSADWPDMIADQSPSIATSCLGTTMRIAGSPQAFRAVDHDLVLSFAAAVRKAGAQHMISVSSVGASPKSSNLYLCIKGEVETALAGMGFDRLDIIRPGLLTGGNRMESRPVESIGIMLAPLTDLMMVGSFGRYRSTPSAKVARAIATLVAAGGKGRFIHENEEITALAG